MLPRISQVVRRLTSQVCYPQDNPVANRVRGLVRLVRSQVAAQRYNQVLSLRLNQAVNQPASRVHCRLPHRVHNLAQGLLLIPARRRRCSPAAGRRVFLLACPRRVQADNLVKYPQDARRCYRVVSQPTLRLPSQAVDLLCILVLIRVLNRLLKRLIYQQSLQY